jgi:hypothetical protein
MIIRGFDNLDWIATLGATGVMLIVAIIGAVLLSLRWDLTVVDLVSATSRRRILPRLVDFGWLKVSIFFVAQVGFGLIFAASAQDPNGLYGQSTAAWVQAAGSVGAILAAIVVDQGSTRRLRRERSQLDLQVAARRARAINEAAIALHAVAEEVKGAQIKGWTAPFWVSQGNILRIKSALAALEYLHQQGAELDGQILASLCNSREMLKLDSEWINKNQPILDRHNLDLYYRYVDSAAERQNDLFKNIITKNIIG